MKKYFTVFICILCIAITTSMIIFQKEEIITVSINDICQNTDSQELISFTWIDEEKIVLKVGKGETEEFWIYDLLHNSYSKIFEIKSNNASISRVVGEIDKYTIAEFGKEAYLVENGFLVEKIYTPSSINDYEKFINANNSDIYYFDVDRMKMYRNDVEIYEFPKEEYMNYPRCISVSPDNKKLSFSCLKGEINIEKNVIIDLMDKNIYEYQVNLLMPFFLWIDNMPAYIYMESENQMCILYGENLNEKRIIEIEGSAHFIDSLYNLGIQNNKLIILEITENSDIISILDLNTFEKKIICNEEKLKCYNYSLSPSAKKIAMLNTSYEDYGEVNLVVKNIK